MSQAILKTEVQTTIIKPDGKEIKVITKTRFPKPPADVTLASSCPASEQGKYHAKQPKETKPYDQEPPSWNLMQRISSVCGKRNRGANGKKRS